MRNRRRPYRDYETDDQDSIGETLADVNDRLDDLARQIARIARRSQADDQVPTSLEDALAHFDRRLDEIVDTERAVRTGQTRGREDRARNAPERPDYSNEPSQRVSAPPAAPAELTVDLSGLENHLRQITEQIAGLHQPCRIDDAVGALRGDLAQIGRAVNEAMPRTELEALERGVRALAEHVDRSRDNGANLAKLAQLEKGLADIHDSLRNMKPNGNLLEIGTAVKHLAQRVEQINASAQNPAAMQKLEQSLAGLRTIVSHAASNDTVGKLADEVRGLSARVDQAMSESSASATNDDSAALQKLEEAMAGLGTMVSHAASNDSVDRLADEVRGLAARVDQAMSESSTGANNENPAAMQKLEQAVTSLRVIVSHVASNDTVGQLAEEVRSLSARFEHAIAENTAHTIANIDHQMQTLAASSAGSSAAPTELETLIHSLSEQINHAQHSQAQLSQGDKLALSSIEDRIVKLSSKLDASDVMVVRLGAIERGMADVLLYLEQQRLLNEQRRHMAQELMAHGRPAQEPRQDPRQQYRQTPNQVPHQVPHQDAQEEPHPHEEPQQESRQESRNDMRHEQRMDMASSTPGPMALETARSPAESDTAFAAVAAAQFSAPEHAINTETIVAPTTNGAAVFAATTTAKFPPTNETPQFSPIDALNSAAAEAKAELSRQAIRQPINPDLPPDTPIEPNPEGAPIRTSAADRIAASEEALGTAKPAGREVASQFETLIAARRAAFAANAEAEPEAAPFKPAFPRPEMDRGRRFGKYLRWLLFAASIVIILLVAMRVGLEMWQLPESTPAAPTDASAPSNLPAPSQNQLNGAPESPRPNPVMPMPGPATLPEAPRGDAPSGPPAAAPNTPPATPPDAPNNEGSSKPDPLGDAGGIKAMPEVTGTLTRQEPEINRSTAQPALPITIGGPVLRSAATAGNPAAEYEVAVRYTEGRGVTANIEEAARWLERAAKAGFAPAQFRLGGLYDKGGGLKKDRALARTFYAAAAEKGHAKAMHNLAVLYAEGIDGRPNYRLAAQWFRKAAEHGVADSQYNLAILCIRGIGVDQNLSEAYKWFALAANQGDQEAGRKRDEVAERLDPPALNIAQVSVQTFRAASQPEQAVSLRVPPGGWDRASTSVQPVRPGLRPGDPNVPNLLLSPAPL